MQNVSNIFPANSWSASALPARKSKNLFPSDMYELIPNATLARCFPGRPNAMSASAQRSAIKIALLCLHGVFELELG